MTSPTLESLRQARQLEFTAGDEPLVVGTPQGLPWPAASLAALKGDEPAVVQRIEGGLTARVFRLRGHGQDWTLKRARDQALVRNVDGQTSFLNEVQRRADLQALKAQPGGTERWAALVDTRYASFREGIILSPWIEGQHIEHWGERQLVQLLRTACALWCEGLFEWDLCPGNILDDGQQLRLFDFGYMYRFDPLRHFNSAGTGADEPLFHPAERFETRNYSGVLLNMAHADGQDAALAAFRLEKAIALEAYRRMRSEIATRGATPVVLGWLDHIIQRWASALQGSAESLYWAEGWRSHRLDLDDDLRGRTCTPMTLRRVDWLLDALQRQHPALLDAGAFFWGDEHKARSDLVDELALQREQARRWQVVPAAVGG